MKKILALALSLILAFSCFTLCAVSPVSAEGASGNLLADYTVYNWTFADDRIIAERTTENPETYKGGYCFGARSVGYRGFYTTFPVTAGNTYVLSFAVKSMYTYEYATLGVASAFNFVSSSGKFSNYSTAGVNVIDLATLNANNYTAAGVFKDEGQWTEVSYEFTPTESVDYALGFSFAALAGSTSTDVSINPYYFAISDLSLSTMETVPTLAEGNGAVKANPVNAFYGDAVTYTATAYQNDQFLGWYDANGNQLSTETTYSGLAGVDTPTAKFTGTNLLADMTAADWESNTSNIVVSDGAAESRYGGKSSVKLQGSWRGTHTTLNLVEGKEYTLRFSYYLPTHANGTEQIQFKLGTNVGYADDGQQSNGSWIKTADITSPLDTWTDYSFTFTATADSADIAITAGWNAGIILSDFSLTTKEAVPTLSEGNGTVTANPAFANTGDAVTYTAKAGTGDSFIGWYVNGEQISTETTYSGFAGVDTPTAKFTSTNLLGTKTVSDWLSLASDNRVLNNAAETTVSKNGGYAFMTTSVHYQAMRLPFSVEANKNYVLTFSVKSSANWEALAVFDATGLAFTEGGGKNYTVSGYNDQAALAAVTANTLSSTVDGAANLAAVDSAVWTDVTIEFTPTAASSEYVLYMSWSDSLGYNDVIVSDLCLKAYETVVTSAIGNGAVKANPAKAVEGQSVTLTANAYNKDAFLGWYVDGEQVSTDATYTITFGNAVPTAKFTSENLAADITADNWDQAKSPVDASAESYLGGNAIKYARAWRGSHLTLATTIGKDYKISFYHKSATGEAGTFEFGVGHDITYSTDENSLGKLSGSAIWYRDSYNSSFATSTEYAKYEITFTADAQTVDIFVGQAGTNFYISDLSLVEATAVPTAIEGDGTVTTSPANGFYGEYEGVTYTATPNNGAYFVGWYDAEGNLLSTEATYTASVTPIAKFTGILANGEGNAQIGGFKGVAIRTTGNQALRFSFNGLSADVLSSSEFAGYTVKETGAIAIRTKYLNGAELTKDATYSGYQTAKAVTFTSENVAATGVVTFALYNIGVTKYTDGTIKSTDFTVYGEALSVRLYKVLEKDGKEIIVYGDTQSATVFDTMKAILDANISETDVAAVNTMLSSATTDTAGLTVKNAYDAYFNN